MVLKGEEFDQGALSPYFPIRFGLARRLLLSEFRRVFKRTALATKALLFSLLQDFFYITPRVKSAGYLEICHCIVLEIYVKQMKKGETDLNSFMRKHPLFHLKVFMIQEKGDFTVFEIFH